MPNNLADITVNYGTHTTSAAVVTISGDELDTVSGGSATTRVAGRLLRKVGSKFIPGVNIASTAYDAYEGYQGYSRAREQGHGVGRSLWEGAKSVAGFGE